MMLKDQLTNRPQENAAERLREAWANIGQLAQEQLFLVRLGHALAVTGVHEDSVRGDASATNPRVDWAGWEIMTPAHSEMDVQRDRGFRRELEMLRDLRMTPDHSRREPDATHTSGRIEERLTRLEAQVEQLLASQDAF
ncbi:hypothetical protein [Streptomyces sp. NPDC093097]|uniref:hypothetical protein n=1 Tax=Streptomyces sp. NPDC093097 TaxID=3366027 RepID=UPI003822A36D